MADIFISYAREDQPLATVLAEELEHAGWEVWWDRDIPVGKDYDLIIDAQLESAKCVIVLWTKDSIMSRNVKDEANEALNRDKLLPIQVGAIRPPIGFRMIQSMIWQEIMVSQRYLAELLGHLQTTLGAPIKLVETKKPKAPEKEKATAFVPELIKPKPRKKPAVAKPKTTPKPNGITEQALRKILAKHPIPKLYFSPDIPDSKEANARKACFIPVLEKVVAILDLTVFGGCDDCLVFSTENIWHHNMNSKAVFCPYSDFPTVVFQIQSDTFFTKTISLNNDFLDMGGITVPLDGVIAILNEIKRQVASGK